MRTVDVQSYERDLSQKDEVVKPQPTRRSEQPHKVVDVREYGGFDSDEDRVNNIQTKEDREKENTIQLGVINHFPMEDSVLWQKRMWRKFNRRKKDDFAKKDKKVELYVETKVEETVVGYHEINRYIVYKSEGEEIDREEI